MLHYKATWLGKAKKKLLLLKFHVSQQKIFLQESMIALHFLRLKLKCACLIFLVPFIGALALFTGVSCSWTFHSCHESSLSLYLPLGHQETRRTGRELCYRLWCKKYVIHTPSFSLTKDPLIMLCFYRTEKRCICFRFDAWVSKSECGRNQKGTLIWTWIYA